MTVQEYIIQNLDCASCAGKIENLIQGLPEVESASLDMFNKKLTVHYHTVIDNPVHRLNQIAAGIEPGVTFSERSEEVQHKPDNRYWIPIGIGAAILIGMQFVTSPYQPYIGVFAYLLVAYRVLLNSGKSLLSKQLFNEQFLMSIATIGAMVLGEYLEAGAVMVLYEVGEYLEHLALEHSRKSIKSMLAVKPEIAHLRSEDGVADVALRMVPVGSAILIFPGERVPLDGVISKGESTVDTSSLTGEAEPLPVTEGNELYAGFLNNSGLLELRVTSTEAESTITRILNLIENAGARKSPQEKFITRFARVYTPAVVALAFLVFLIPVLLGAEAAIWFKRSLVFLIVSCPCALVISIPLTYFIGIGIAARKGIILKGSSFLDTLRKVRTVVFDKTGTLTTGEMQLDSVLSKDDSDPADLLQTLYLCEYTSSHPFALAVKRSFDGVYDSQKVNSFAEYPGKGILLDYAGDHLIAGSAAFLAEHGFVDLIPHEGRSMVHAVKNNVYLGCATFSDEVKSGIGAALSALKSQGVLRTIMLSGDKDAKALKVSQQIGLDTYYAELLPEQKLEKLEQIITETDGKVAFVGDGMNDAPSLARADVGIAMGGIGNQSSIESADVVLLNDKPEQLSDLFSISHRTGVVVVQNIVLALGIKVLVMALGVSGISGLWEAIIADVGVTLLVVFNSLRMMRFQRNA